MRPLQAWHQDGARGGLCRYHLHAKISPSLRQRGRENNKLQPR